MNAPRDILGAIVTPVSGTADGPQCRNLTFPIAQDMGGDAGLADYLTNAAKRCRCLASGACCLGHGRVMAGGRCGHEPTGSPGSREHGAA